MHIGLSEAVGAPARSDAGLMWLCGAVLFLEGYDIAAVGYAVPSLVDAWKIQPSELTKALTAGNVGLMIGSVCAGLLGDRVGRKPVLIVCVAIFAAFSLLSAFVTSPSQLGSLRFLTGLGLGGGLPITFALASSLAPELSQVRLLIRISISVPIGFAAGGVLANRLVRIGGWPLIFIVGGVFPLILAPLLAVSLPSSSERKFAPRRRVFIAALFQKGLARSTLLLWAINALNLLGIYFFLLWMPSILHSQGASSSMAILGTTIYGLGVIASPALSTLLVDRVSVELVLAYGLGFGAVCVLAIGIIHPAFWLLSVLVAGAGIGNGCQAGIISLSALAYPPAIRSSGAGWALGVGRVGTIGGPLLGGVLMGAGLATHNLFRIVSIPAFIAAALMVILGRTRQRGEQTLFKLPDYVRGL